jgi:hypothetical protein
MGYEPVCRQGTVTVTHPGGGIATFTGAGTDFQPDMVGSIIRLGTTTFEADPVGALRAFVAEAEITAYSTTTGIAASSSVLPVAAATTKYAISDKIDCSPQMYTAILSACEMWYARLAGKPGADVVQLFNRDLRLAMERDVVSPLSGQPSPIGYPTPRTLGYYSSQQPDQGS